MKEKIPPVDSTEFIEFIKNDYVESDALYWDDESRVLSVKISPPKYVNVSSSTVSNNVSFVVTVGGSKKINAIKELNKFLENEFVEYDVLDTDR